MTVDPLEIEDTSDWLGSPTWLETIKHYASMLEEDIQALKRELRAAKENISGLVVMNDLLSASNARLINELKKTTNKAAQLREENTELSGRVHSLLRVSDQRDHLFSENQRLLREMRD